MIDTPMDPLVRWVVDVHVLGSLLLALWAASLLRVRQPVASARGRPRNVRRIDRPGRPVGDARLAPAVVARCADPEVPRPLPSVGSARPEPCGPRPDVAALSRDLGPIPPAPERPDHDRSAEDGVTAAAMPVPAWFNGPSIVEGLTRPLSCRRHDGRGLARSGCLPGGAAPARQPSGAGCDRVDSSGVPIAGCDYPRASASRWPWDCCVRRSSCPRTSPRASPRTPWPPPSGTRRPTSATATSPISRS